MTERTFTKGLVQTRMNGPHNWVMVKFNNVCPAMGRRVAPIDADTFLQHIEECDVCSQLFSAEDG